MNAVREVSHVSFKGVSLRGLPFRSAKVPIVPGARPTAPPEVVFLPETDVEVHAADILSPVGNIVWTEAFQTPVRVYRDKQLRLPIPDAILMRFNGKVSFPFLG